MTKKSAGLLVYNKTGNHVKVFLAHPGGPFYKNKDLGSWTIPKGEFEDNEDPLEAARREFKEEIGVDILGKFIPLSPFKIKSGKLIFAWAVEANIEAENISSNTFSLEWPPRSGKFKDFPEIDKAEWFAIPEAFERISSGQKPMLHELQILLAELD